MQDTMHNSVFYVHKVVNVLNIMISPLFATNRFKLSYLP